jgi:hypothetical protein
MGIVGRNGNEKNFLVGEKNKTCPEGGQEKKGEAVSG